MATKIQRSFAGGEIAPALYGRADQAKYQTGLRTCRNFMVMRHGGVTNRPGTKFIAEVKDNTAKTYLMKFVFNSSQTYVIEMGNLYFRFYKDGAQLESGGNPYEIVTPYVTADLGELHYVQSGDIVTITHPNYQPRELARTADTSWTLTVVTTAPSLSAPTTLAATAGAAGSLDYEYVVTAIEADTYDESLASTADAAACVVPTLSVPNTLTWDAVVGAVEYNVYLDRDQNGVYGFIGVAQSNSFSDIGYIPDLSATPPVSRTLFATASNYPSTAAYYQQRLGFANTDTNPETVWFSRSAHFKNFNVSSPIQDDDSVEFTIAANQVQEVRHMIPLNRLVVLTEGGEWVIRGDANGILSPFSIHAEQEGYNGSSFVRPVVVTNSIIFCQSRQSIIRDLRYDVVEDGYQGRDLTIFAAHLFRDYTITRLDYAQNPDSIVWAMRSDGTLLGLTYLREHEIWGWHRHDSINAEYEDLTVVPEGQEDMLYVTVKRTIGTQTKRFIERMASRRVTDVKVDALFLDSYLSYDGRNSAATTVTVSDSTNDYEITDLLTVTASASVWVAGDVGNAVAILDDDDEEIFRVTITGFTSATVVTGYANKTVPDAHRNVPTTSWADAVDSVTGLTHIAGETVSVLADGNVLAQEEVTVGGAVTLDKPYSVIHVGLPVTADVELLDLDIEGSEIRARRKNITSVNLIVEATRGGFVGPDASNLYEFEPELVKYQTSGSLYTGLLELNITSTWNETGRVLIRQSDPLPFTLLAAIPSGQVGG